MEQRKSEQQRPQALVILSTMGQIDLARWKRINELFEVLIYDCSTIQEFIQRLQPGGLYSAIEAIVRTGWRNGGPFVDTTIFRADFIHHYPSTLKIILCAGHGHDAVDLGALIERGILYCNSPDCATDAVANTGLHLILSSYRYYSFAERCVRQEGQWNCKIELADMATDPSGDVLGVVGLGDIGLAVARKAALALDMEIHYVGTKPKPESEACLPRGATYHDTLDSLLQVADCIVLACPYTSKTHHMMSTQQFSQVKSTGLRLVNVARGKLVDETALIRAIAKGQIVGWATDVHEHEPEIDEQLKSNYMTTLLPHIGVCSRKSWYNFERKCLNNLEEYFYGPAMGKAPTSALNARI